MAAGSKRVKRRYPRATRASETDTKSRGSWRCPGFLDFVCSSEGIYMDLQHE